jgi:hypothetical protein
MAAILLGLILPLSSLAQDTNPGDCAVNGKSDIEDCSLADSATAAADILLDDTTRTLDWAPIDTLPTELHDRQCINCAGRYIDPLAGEKNKQPPEDAKIDAHANST